MSGIKMGFEPVFDERSELLILGSFPSVKSREVSFYYGNKQNRFWRTISSFFDEELPVAKDEKEVLVLRHKIALWDIVTECEIEGSSDSSIKNYRIADLGVILNAANIKKIALNGATAYSVFREKYADINIPYVKLPSTSPANPRFDANKWYEVLDDLR